MHLTQTQVASLRNFDIKNNSEKNVQNEHKIECKGGRWRIMDV